MKTIIGVNSVGDVLLISTGQDASIMPIEWNGITITAYTLTDKQISDYAGLPSNRGGATFDGNKFIAKPPVVVTPLSRKPDLLETALIKKGVISKAEVDAEIK